MRSARTLAAVAVSGLMLAPLAGCGAAASSAPATPPPTAKPATQVRLMLPPGVAGTRLLKVQMETIKDQLAPAGARGAARFDALTRRSWLASAHSVFQVSEGGIFILASVNEFNSIAEAKQLYRLGKAMHSPHQRTLREQVPPGAAPGSRYICAADKKNSLCELEWRQGNVIAVAILLGKGPSALDRGVAAQVAPKLKAVQVQMVARILTQTHIAPGQ